MDSPYKELPVSDWESKTRELIQQHPLDPNEIYEVIIQVWQEIFESNLTSRGDRIGVDLFPRPQIMGFFLHELIPLEFSNSYPGIWKRDEKNSEKDMVYLPDDYFSIEIKTSSSKHNIYGNRSYAQKNTTGQKGKSGYYLAVNFQKFEKNKPGHQIPEINLVRFGWIDFSDW